MKKLLLIVFLFVICSLNFALSSEKIGYFECWEPSRDTKTFPSSELIIDLNQNIMRFPIPHKISKINDEKIIAFRIGKGPDDEFKRELTFDRYTGSLTFTYYGKKLIMYFYKCKKVDRKKIF